MKNSSKRSDQEVAVEVCSMCGAAANDSWETEPAQHVVLQQCLRHGDESQLWVLCDECNEGLQNTAPPKPDRLHLLAQVRRATIDDQRAVLDWLMQKYNLTSERKPD